MRPELVEGCFDKRRPERFDELSACFARLDLLIDWKQNKITNIDVARSGQHVQDGIGDILRGESSSSSDAISDRGSVRDLL